MAKTHEVQPPIFPTVVRNWFPKATQLALLLLILTQKSIIKQHILTQMLKLIDVYLIQLNSILGLIHTTQIISKYYIRMSED